MMRRRVSIIVDRDDEKLEFCVYCNMLMTPRGAELMKGMR